MDIVKQNKIQSTNKKKTNIKSRGFYIVLLVAILLGISTLINTSITSNIDEGLTILCGGYLIFKFLCSRLKKSIFPILILLTLTVVGGLISNKMSGIERTMFQISVDILTTVKPFIIFSFVIQVADKEAMYKLKQFLTFTSKILLTVFFILWILNMFGVVNFSSTYVFGLKNFRMFGFAANFGILLFSLFGLSLTNDTPFFKQPFFWISLTLITFTFKAQSVFFLFLFIALEFFMKLNKKQLKLKWIIVAALFVIPTMVPKITNYFATTAYSPRKVFLTDSFFLFKTYFPFGSGFSTFGSPMAAQYFSPAYSTFGYYNLYGMGANDDISFLNDNFFAAIIGQFGLIGILLFSILLFYVLKLILKEKIASNTAVFNVSSIIALVGTTIASSFFTSSVGALLIVVVCINYLSEKKNCGEGD